MFAATPGYVFECPGAVERVTDGDTLWVWAQTDVVQWQRRRVRLAYVNAPETDSHDPAEKAKALAAKEWLTKRLPIGTSVVMRWFAVDHFGRYVSTVQVGGIDVGAEMLDLGLVTKYKAK